MPVECLWYTVTILWIIKLVFLKEASTLFYIAPYTLYNSTFPFFAAQWLRGKKSIFGIIQYRGSLFFKELLMIFLNSAKPVFPPYLEGIARNFYIAGSNKKPQIFTFRLNSRLYYLLRRDRDSNPGRTCILNGFQDRRIQPLCHLSLCPKNKWKLICFHYFEEQI